MVPKYVGKEERCHFCLSNLMKCFIRLEPIGHLDQGYHFLFDLTKCSICEVVKWVIINQID
jgi:hypothetical protein